jgi:5'-nucleotidase
MKWVFWDLGDTLMNEDPLRCELFRKLHARLPQYSWDTLMGARETVLRNGALAPHWALARCELPAVEFDEWRVEVGAFTRGQGQHLIQPVTGARETLESLADYRHGIIADQPAEVLKTLHRVGLRDYFEVIVLSEVVGINKPDPAIYRRALDEAVCEPGDAVMIGNRCDMDIKPAIGVGMHPILCQLSPRNKGWEPADEEALAYMDSLERLPNWTRPDDLSCPVVHDLRDIPSVIASINPVE